MRVCVRVREVKKKTGKQCGTHALKPALQALVLNVCLSVCEKTLFFAILFLFFSTLPFAQTCGYVGNFEFNVWLSVCEKTSFFSSFFSNLALCVELRVRGPLGVLLEPLPHLLVAQDVEKPCLGFNLGFSLGSLSPCRTSSSLRMSKPLFRV